MLIVDVTFAEESARLIASTLGWAHVARLSQKRKALGGKNPFGVMRRTTADLLAQLDGQVLDRMKYHLRHELELYGTYVLLAPLRPISRALICSIPIFFVITRTQPFHIAIFSPPRPLTPSIAPRRVRHEADARPLQICPRVSVQEDRGQAAAGAREVTVPWLA